MKHIKKNLVVTSIKSDSCFELIKPLFETKKYENIALLACYRPLLYSEAFLDCVEDKVMNLVGSVFDIIVAGDLNYDMSIQHTVLQEFFDSLGFMNVIKKITRLNPITFS